jgi:hypothetical protein
VFLAWSNSIQAVSKLYLLAALLLSGNADYLKAFEPHQLHALAKISLRLRDYGFGIDFRIFGFVQFTGIAFQIGLFSQTLGVLMTIAGLVI